MRWLHINSPFYGNCPEMYWKPRTESKVLLIRFQVSNYGTQLTLTISYGLGVKDLTSLLFYNL